MNIVILTLLIIVAVWTVLIGVVFLVGLLSNRAKNKDENMDSQQISSKDFDEKVLYSRNITMTDKLEEYFNSGYNTFFMVGAGHLVGEDGIANLLVQRGYTVKQVNK